MEACCCGSLSFTNVSARAWCGIGSCAWDVVYVAIGLFLVEFVLGFYECFSYGASRVDGSAQAFVFENARKGLGDAGKEWKSDVAEARFGGRRRKRRRRRRRRGGLGVRRSRKRGLGVRRSRRRERSRRRRRRRTISGTIVGPLRIAIEGESLFDSLIFGFLEVIGRRNEFGTTCE